MEFNLHITAITQPAFICSKPSMETSKQCRSGIFIVNSAQISQIALMFLLLLSK